MQKAAIAGFSLIIILFSYLTWARISVWKDSKTLFTDVIRKFPENYYGYYFRGNAKNSEK